MRHLIVEIPTEIDEHESTYLQWSEQERQHMIEEKGELRFE